MFTARYELRLQLNQITFRASTTKDDYNEGTRSDFRSVDCCNWPYFFLSRSAGEDAVKMWHCRTELSHRMLMFPSLLALIATAFVHAASASEQVSLSYFDPFLPTHRRATVAPDNTHSVELLWTKTRSVAETRFWNKKKIHIYRHQITWRDPNSQTYALDRAASVSVTAQTTNIQILLLSLFQIF